MAWLCHPLCDVSFTPKPYKSIKFIQFSSLSMKNHIFFLQSLCFINSSGHSKSLKGSRNHQAENGFLWKYVERERALNGGDTLSSRPLIDGSLSTEFLWQSKSHRGAHWRTHRAERQNTRIHEKILEMAAVKTTWVESLGQDSSMCWTHIENFNLCEKFDKNTFWQNLSFYFRPMIIILWQYYPIPFWAWMDFFESWRCQYSKILW